MLRTRCVSLGRWPPAQRVLWGHPGIRPVRLSTIGGGFPEGDISSIWLIGIRTDLSPPTLTTAAAISVEPGGPKATRVPVILLRTVGLQLTSTRGATGGGAGNELRQHKLAFSNRLSPRLACPLSLNPGADQPIILIPRKGEIFYRQQPL